MHRLKIFVILILCIAASCMAAESHVSLYGKWQNADNSRLMDIARDLVDRNSCDSALVCYSIVADRLRDNTYLQEDKKLLSRALNNIGFIYGTYFFDYKAAVNALQESLKVSIESGYDENLSFVNLNLGGVYLGCNIMYGKNLFSDEVWNYLHRASESAVSSEQYEVAFVAFLNMGQMYFLDRQNEQMKEAISLLRRADVPADMPLAAYCDRYSRGLEAYMSGNYNQALAMFNSMMPLIPQGDLLAPKYELIILSAIVDTCRELGDYAAAIETASLLLDKSRAYGVSDVETNTYRTLSELYDLTGRSDMATQNLLRFHHKKDSILTERDMATLSKLPLVNELESINRQLAEESAKRRIMIVVSIVTLVFVILLGLYLMTVIRSRRKLRLYVKELYRKNRELIESEKRAKELRESKSVTQEGKYSSSSLTAPESKRIAESIQQVMDNTELITNPGFSLAELAERIECSTKVVSQVVNETLGKNFKTLLGECRIREAYVRLLDTDTYGQYTIEHIAESVGFNSRSNFSVTFKKITGLTPAQFQKSSISDSGD